MSGVTVTVSNTHDDDFRNGNVRLRVGDVEVVMDEDDITDPAKVSAAVRGAV